MIDRFINAGQEVKSTVIMQLPLEMAIIEILGDQEAETRTISHAVPVTPNKAIKEDPEKNIEDAKGPEKIVEFTREEVKEISNVSFENKISEISISEKVSETNIGNINIKEKWIQLRSYLKQDYYSLSCILSTANPEKIENNKLVVAFKHKFNLQKVLEPRNLDVLNTAIKKIYELDMVLDIVHDESLEVIEERQNSVSYEKIIEMNNPVNKIKQEAQTNSEQKNKQEQNPVQNVLEVFGGEIIK